MRVAARHQLPLLASALIGLWLLALTIAGDAVLFHHPPAALRVVAAAIVAIGIAAAVRAAVHLACALNAGRRLARGLMRVATADTELGPRVFVVPGQRPLAACLGFIRPSIVISQATRCRLGPAELAAVIAHERHHAVRRDPLRAALLGALRAAFGRRGPVARLVDADRLRREIDADHCAAVTGPGRSALAAAFLATDGWDDHGVDARRVDRLAGRPVDLCPPRRDLVTLGLAAAVLTTTLVLLFATTGCVSGPECGGHVHPAVVAGLAAITAVILLRPRRTTT